MTLQQKIDRADFDAMDIEQIFWVDSMSFNGWRPKSELENISTASFLCRSVGYVYGEDEERLCIVQSEGNFSANDALHIPKAAVISRRLLAKGKEALNAGHGHARKI